MGHIYWNEYFRLLDSSETVDVLAIGDSWFHYPFNNLITPLYEALERPTIFVIGENGARADELCAGAWVANLSRMLVGYPAIRLVCISAGGNDFAGVGDLDDKLLKPPGRPAVELVWFAGTLADTQWANELHPTPSAFARLVNDCWSGPARRALGLA